jgi:hypothetical protein
MTDEVKSEILKMSFGELVDYLSTTGIAVPMKALTAITQRLYEIALYDHRVLIENRKAAWEYLDTVKALVEEGFKDRPEAVAAYKAANRQMEEGARKIGFGSLCWLVEENGISGTDELVVFISQPEHGPLLDDFFSVVGPELADELKAEMARSAKLVF